MLFKQVVSGLVLNHTVLLRPLVTSSPFLRTLALDRLAHDGESLSTVLQRVRIEIACRTLDGSDCSLTEVADAAGFESLSSFSRWFQKSFCCTATDWRAQQAVRGPGGRLQATASVG